VEPTSPAPAARGPAPAEPRDAGDARGVANIGPGDHDDRRDRSDELLTEIPAGADGEGPLQAYGHGRWVRRSVFGLAVAGVVAGVLAGRSLWLELEARRRSRPPAYVLDPTVDGRPTEITWTEGRARLGLTRGDPPITRIRLPDRTLELAPHADAAQVLVEVRDGVTVRVQVLSGEITDRGQVDP
jgi:hypothetical protein